MTSHMAVIASARRSLRPLQVIQLGNSNSISPPKFMNMKKMRADRRSSRFASIITIDDDLLMIIDAYAVKGAMAQDMPYIPPKDYESTGTLPRQSTSRMDDKCSNAMALMPYVPPVDSMPYQVQSPSEIGSTFSPQFDCPVMPPWMAPPFIPPPPVYMMEPPPPPIMAPPPKLPPMPSNVKAFLLKKQEKAMRKGKHFQFYIPPTSTTKSGRPMMAPDELGRVKARAPSPPPIDKGTCRILCCSGHTRLIWIIVAIVLVGVIAGLILGFTLVEN